MKRFCIIAAKKVKCAESAPLSKMNAIYHLSFREDGQKIIKFL